MAAGNSHCHMRIEHNGNERSDHQIDHHARKGSGRQTAAIWTEGAAASHPVTTVTTSSAVLYRCCPNIWAWFPPACERRQRLTATSGGLGICRSTLAAKVSNSSSPSVSIGPNCSGSLLTGNRSRRSRKPLRRTLVRKAPGINLPRIDAPRHRGPASLSARPRRRRPRSGDM